MVNELNELSEVLGSSLTTVDAVFSHLTDKQQKELSEVRKKFLIATKNFINLVDGKLSISKIRETGSSRTGTLTTSYNNIIEKLFEPNVTDMDDEDKVPASWGFKDNRGRKGFIWLYKYYGKEINGTSVYTFSIDGNKDLFIELFGSQAVE
jgi:hypothetical protein